MTKDIDGWQIQGHLLQSGKKIFHMPIEIAIDTKNGRKIQSLWIDDKVLHFNFHTKCEPEKLVVDPESKILKLQRMPQLLSWFWNSYPDYLVAYGTLKEAEANKAAAESFAISYMTVKADTDVNDTDLKGKCVFLIGRPETNSLAQRFKDSFPIKFDNIKFIWRGRTYSKPAHSVAQMIENPMDGKERMLMFAGLSPETTLKVNDLNLFSIDSSYAIFERDKQLSTGNWEDVDTDLFWSRNSHAFAVSLSHQR